MNHSPMRSCQIVSVLVKVTPEDTFSTFIFPSMITSGSGPEASKNHDGPLLFNLEIFFVFPKQLWFDLSSVEHPHALVDFKQVALILLPLFFFQHFLYHNHVDWNVSMFQIFLLVCSWHSSILLARTPTPRKRSCSLSYHQLINIKAF